MSSAFSARVLSNSGEQGLQRDLNPFAVDNRGDGKYLDF